MNPALLRPAFLASAEQPRVAALIEPFRQSFGSPPTFAVRAPGRVNLIGEHTDYNGLPVLPMAIDRSVRMVGRPRTEPVVRLRNRDDHYPSCEFPLDAAIPPTPNGDWSNYARAATQALKQHLGDRLRFGADLWIEGDIPPGAGLSSSAALVVATSLALLTANGREIPRNELATLLAEAERYVGTLSGGMDQAISLLGEPGSALRIDFFPLRTRPVHLPPEAAIVVCHSLVTAEKAGLAREAYNRRVIEGRLACRVLEAALGESLPHGLGTLGDLRTWFPGRRLPELLEHLGRHLPDRPLRLVEIGQAIAMSPQLLAQRCGIAAGDSTPFQILARARHVLSEAERVERAEASLAAGDITAFGELMNASHASCRDDYEISCPALEELVAIAREAGALGARLTGAGFGGCTVNLVRRSETEAFLAAIDRGFYRSRRPRDASVERFRFVFLPQPGAEAMHLPLACPETIR